MAAEKQGEVWEQLNKVLDWPSVSSLASLKLKSENELLKRKVEKLQKRVQAGERQVSLELQAKRRLLETWGAIGSRSAGCQHWCCEAIG
jgi:hypothetical protein